MTRVLLIGDGALADDVEGALGDAARLRAPGAEELAAALPSTDRVAIVADDDATALRATLMVRAEDRDVPLLVTLAGHTAATQLQAADPHADITSMAEIVAPSLAGPCFGDDVAAVCVRAAGPVAVRVRDGRADEEPFVPPERGNRVLGLVSALARPYDRSAALLVYGFLGLAGVLAAESVGAVIVLDQNATDALYGATKTLVTVDPNDGVAKGPAGFKRFTTVAMLLALFFEALFTAGIVNRLIDRRLTGWVGRRAVPRRHHVVVVGLGKIGLRLCELLRSVGVRVVGVDDREDGEDVGFAREAGIPVVIGRGADPSLLRRLALKDACALVAATGDDLENLAIAMAARSLAPELRIVLRVQDGRIAGEARSLLGFGAVRDVHRLAAALLAARATGSEAEEVLLGDDAVHLVGPGGRLERVA